MVVTSLHTCAQVLEKSHIKRGVVVYYCRTYVKAVRGGLWTWGGSEERGRVLWGATSRGLCGRVGPPRTNVRVLRRVTLFPRTK